MLDLAIVDICKNQSVPSYIVRAIIKNESARNPLSINVNHKGKSLISYNPKTKEKAFQLAKSWINKGYTVDIGLMQFNSANFGSYPKYSIKDMLDPCKNIKVASTIYHRNFIAINKKYSFSQRVLMALSAYNTGSYTKGFKNGYVAKYEPSLSSHLKPNSFNAGVVHIKAKPVKKRIKDNQKFARLLLRIKAPTNIYYD